MENTKLPEDEETKLESTEQVLAEELPLGVVVKEEVSEWTPKTTLGKMVKEKKITSIDHILDNGLKILEYQIIDLLVPNLEIDYIMVGQSKGKFGGGKRSIWRQTQKKSAEGNKPQFAALAIIGNKNGYIGMGYAKAKETVPAREKAIRKAKLNIIKIKRGCGSWECHCKSPHSIPFAVESRCSSVRINLMPAPKGSSLSVEKECAKMLIFAGIKDIYSKTSGQTRTKLNLLRACFDCLQKLSTTKVNSKLTSDLGIVEGAI